MTSSAYASLFATGLRRVPRTTEGDRLVCIDQSDKGRERSEKNVETR